MINKLSNEYAATLGGDLYGSIPKAVFAALAVSALTCGGDQLDHARALLVTEWDVLHGNGIVPQAVPARFRALIGAGGDDE